MQRAVIVTGGSTGIGYAAARRFGRDGDRVLITARTESVLFESAAELQTEGIEVVAHVADVASSRDVVATVARAVDELGAIDVLINNAGLGLEEPLIEMDDDAWGVHTDVNLGGTFRMSREVARVMIAAGRGGVILNTSSINATFVEPDLVAYSASKAGIDALTVGMAVEFAPHGIRVLSVQPGYINTPIIDKAFPEPEERKAYIDRTVATVPLRRLGEADEVANLFFFLASNDASYMTGTSIVIDGGRLATR